MIKDDSQNANCAQGSASDKRSTDPAKGMSPYAEGGGGVTIERRVAVEYLAHLLVGDGAPELGNGRHVVSVSFQQAPDYPVDDLVIHAARSDESEPSLVLSLEVRRSPNLVSSDESAQALIRKFARTLMNEPSDSMEHRWGLVISGSRSHAVQLRTLADLAADQMDASGFFNLVRTPNRFTANVRNRLDHIERLVGRALKDLGTSEPDTQLVQERTWQLLSNLVIRMPRLESPDETDWSAVENSLISVARGSDLAGASRLRDRLFDLAGEYSPKSARIDLTLLRRDVHDRLNSGIRRHREAWRLIDRLHRFALESVSDEIASADGARRVSVDRSEAATKLTGVVKNADAVLVSGDSGVGKSALTIMALSTVWAADSEVKQGLCINLRHIPELTIELEKILGFPLSALLCELSAPERVLVIDGADAAIEDREDAFRYLVDAAVESGVKVVAVASTESIQVVHEILSEHFRDGVSEYPVEMLNDSELNEIVTTFPELNSLNSNPRSRNLLRRLVVVDLLVRSGPAGLPLSDADAMRVVWSKLVRREERSDRGHPDARETVMLRLAALMLDGGERLDVVGSLDGAAMAGLRHDGLLQVSLDHPFTVGPDFAHDEVRRYAVARLLLADRDPTSRILRAGAPRWALGAARLACQALLEQRHSASIPLRGRFTALQDSFDKLMDGGYGARWGDVPSEALVTLADPSAVLRDAWFKLQSSDAVGLRRLTRVVDQRLRDQRGMVSLNVLEPIVELLLEDATPWQSGEHAIALLRDWLHSHAFSRTPSGHSLRTLLRERLVEAYREGDRCLIERQEAEVAARAARTPEDIERERQLLEKYPWLYTEIGYGGRTQRQRPEVPRECRNKVFLELLALLGPDLGEEGEAILRRVAQDAPWLLAPALEETLTGFALASYGRGLLAHLTQEYYLDDEADSSETFDDDGIRPHDSRSVGLFSPLASAYHGPFISLFHSDFRTGVATLNRMLNHASLIRARKLADLNVMRHSGMGYILEDPDIGRYRVELNISGTPRHYIGDQPVYVMYRGTGVGPYPCISALMALEVMCDQLIKAGLSLTDLVSVLLDGCENLAMIGFVVGMLVRHMESAGDLLDPYFTEPLIWNYEFARVVGESSMTAASSEGVEAPERRLWSLREAAANMTMRAGDARVEELRALGDTLVERARRMTQQEQHAGAEEGETNVGMDSDQYLAIVSGWASSLDRSNYRVYDTPDGRYIEATIPEEVSSVLDDRNEDLQRVTEELRLAGRYFLYLTEEDAESIDAEELTADLASVRKLQGNQTPTSVYEPLEVAALVASVAIDTYVLRHADIPDDGMVFAVETVLSVAEGDGPRPHPYQYEDTYNEQGADRSAARAIPILLLPAATHLRAIVDGPGGSTTFNRASAAGIKIARSMSNEVRLHLARGMDHLWATPCVQDGPCHHQIGWQIATEMVRDCVVGDWDPDAGGRSVTVLAKPLTKSIENALDDSILPFRLDASIRALAPAAMAGICASASARELLATVLDAQRRSLLAGERNSFDNRGTHSLVSARALLTLVRNGDDKALFQFIDAYANNAALLSTLLSALSAVAEETPERAETARRVWPSIIHRVLDLYNRGHIRIQKDRLEEGAVAALLPNVCYKHKYLYREIQKQPITWWDPLELRSEVETWLGPAAGKASCVDHLIGFLKVIMPEEQARVGIPWVAKLVLPDHAQIAKESFMLAEWLIEVRSFARTPDLSDRWQEIVDALVVEGVRILAPYSE